MTEEALNGSHTSITPDSIREQIDRLGPHQHFCMLHETKEEQFSVAVPFIGAGLAKGEQCMYIADENSPEEVAGEMRKGRIEVGEALSKGALNVIAVSEACVVEGRFSPERMIESLSRMAEDADRLGFTGLRVAVEMSWFLDGPLEHKQFIEHETRLHELFDRHRCPAICQYNVTRFPAAVLLDVLRIHPYVILQGKVCSNHLFDPRQKLFDPEAAKRVLESQIESILDRREGELHPRRTPESIPHWERAMAEVLDGQFRREVTSPPAAEGEKRHHGVSLTPVVKDDEVIGTSETTRDVTDTVLTTEALRASDERYRELADSVSDLFYATDRDLKITYWNKAIEKLKRIPAVGAIGRSCYDVFPHLRGSRVEKAYREVLDTKTARRLEVEYHAEEGTIIVFDTNIYPSREGLAVIAKDVTEERRVERMIRLERQRLFSILEKIPAFVHLQRMDCSICYANSSFKLTFGDPIGRKCYEAIHHRSTPCEECPVQNVFNTRDQAIHEFVRHGGRAYLVYTNCLDDFDGAPVVLKVGMDITERKEAEGERLRLQSQVQHAQKMESLGILAGGIAHDFNNILMGVLGNADMASSELPADSPVMSYLEDIRRASKRASDLCRQMLAYSGKGAFIIDDLDLNSAVSEMANLLKASISKKAMLEFELSPDHPAIRADSNQVCQVIMNLIMNASEALSGESGYITIRTGTERLDGAALEALPGSDKAEPGDFAYLDVTDTGIGIDEDAIQKIFDPFFTTKFTGRGLGLSTLLGITRGHCGAVRIVSKPGQGTSFRVFFPRLEKSNACIVAESGPAERVWKGHGSVLLVDDEDVVLAVGLKMLEKLGFDVLTARDGRQALDTYGGRKGDIRCVILDMSMPGMSGEETFDELRRISPDAKIVLSSGYAETEIVQRFVGKGVSGYIQKPYDLADISKVLHKTLG